MKNISRRNFLAKASSFGLLAATIQFLPSRILAKDSISPSNRINIGYLGVGNNAKSHLGFITSTPRAQAMALCDVNRKNLISSEKTVNENAQKNSNIAYRPVDIYEDYQEVIDRDDIDAIWISAPDQWHVQMAIAALAKNKAVYVEKPISLTIEEGRILADFVKKTRGILQVGSQQRSDAQFRKAAELVRNGYLGKMKRIDVSLGKFPAEPTDLPEEAIPDGFNYEKWLGQCPWKAYNAKRVSGAANKGWRCFYDYGARKDGDWGAHHYDIVQWALNRDTSAPCEFYPENFDGESLRYFKYDTGETVYVNDPDLNQYKVPTIRFTGEDAEIVVNRNIITCTKPYLLKQVLQSKDTRLEVSTHHDDNLLDAIAYGNKNIAPAETGHRTATVCQLMSIARRTKEAIKWNPKTETITQGSDKAKSMLSRARRSPYFIGV